jgi:hypothetical protein
VIARLLLALALWSAAVGVGAAHEVRPAYLLMEERAENEFDVLWKTPAVQAGVLAVQPQLPASCAPLSEPGVEVAPGALISRWRVRCDGGLSGAVRIEGLERTLTSAFIRVVWRDGGVAEGVIDGGRPMLSLDRGGAPPVLDYLRLGVEHIIGGIDHLGFIVGLVLVVAGWRRLLVTLTAFTLAHSLTLGAAALGFIGLPQRPVEVVIAFSIAVVAREAWLGRDKVSGVMRDAPWIVAFAFGLLHGFGFASALADIGLPANARLMALVLFNVGVEIGQVAVVCVLAPLVAWLRTGSAPRTLYVERTAALVLGAASMYWVCERLA